MANPAAAIPAMAAAGFGIGFGIGYAAGGLFIWTIAGALAGAGIGLWRSSRAGQVDTSLLVEQQ